MEHPQARKLKILAVDDEPLILRALARMLKGCGAVLETCDDERRALELVRAAPPDLLIIDLRTMPMNGLELVASVRGLAPDLPAILFTGTPPRTLPPKVWLVTKPGTKEQLLEAVVAATGTR